MKKSSRKDVKNKFAWRKNKKVWTDTMFSKKLLANPSLMSNIELATALKEHQMWRLAIDKYEWEEDPFKENAEQEPPFSPCVLTRLLTEAIARLQISGAIALGRFKENGKSCK